LPVAGDCRQRNSAGHARVLAGGWLIGSVPGRSDHRGAAVFAGLSLGGAALCLLLAVPVGLLVVRYKANWRSGPSACRICSALPGLVIALTLVYFALHYVPALYQTSALLLIAYALLFLPLAQAPIRTALNKAAPQLEEAARTLGASSFTAFCR
jgi:iron(III) transport system permease protein